MEATKYNKLRKCLERLIVRLTDRMDARAFHKKPGG